MVQICVTLFSCIFGPGIAGKDLYMLQEDTLIHDRANSIPIEVMSDTLWR